jgi:hypothetical protein
MQTQLAELPGLARPLAVALREREPGLAGAFEDARRRVHERRFPLQINLAPTLACQLSCAYCVSAGIEARSDTTRSWSDLISILDWARERGVRRVGLTGGEPTVYPRFTDLLREIGRRGLELYLATNGLMSAEALSRLVEARPLGVSLHLAPDVRSEGRFALFRRAAEALVGAGVSVALRVNLVSPTDDVEALASVAADLGVGEMRAAVPIPNAGRRNAFVTVGSLGEYGVMIDRLIVAARRKGVSVVLCKPFPICALPERSGRSLLAGGSLAVNCPVHLSDYTNNLVVWPNRSYSPCLGVNTVVERDVTEFAALAQAAFAYRPLIDRLTHEPVLQTCLRCPLWSGARCLGGCLSYRLSNGEI